MAYPKDDLVVNIAESPSATGGKPGVEAPAAKPGVVQRAKDWVNDKPRNKYLAGGALASLLLLPCIIAPAAVASQKPAAKGRSKVPDWGAYRSAGSKSAYLDPLVRFVGWMGLVWPACVHTQCVGRRCFGPAACVGP